MNEQVPPAFLSSKWAVLLCGLLATAACDASMLPVPVRVVDVAQDKVPLEELPEMLEDACHVIGIECAPTDDLHGSVRVTIQPLSEPGVLGEGRDEPMCKPWMWIASDAPLGAWAHELAHTLGLNHVDDPDNLMTGGVVESLTLTTAQRRKVSRRADFVVTCP